MASELYPKFVYSSVMTADSDETGPLKCWLHTTIYGDDQDELYRQAKAITERVNALPTPVAPVSPDATGKCWELETVTYRGKFKAEGQDQWEYYPTPDSGFDPDKYEQQALVARSQAEELLAAERAEKKEARRAEEEAKDCFWSIYETYLEKGGLPVSTEGARSALSNRIASLEADNAAKDARIKELGNIKENYEEANDRMLKTVEYLEAKLTTYEDALEEAIERRKARAALGGKP